jgi:hypothetical protein
MSGLLAVLNLQLQEPRLAGVGTKQPSSTRIVVVFPRSGRLGSARWVPRSGRLPSANPPYRLG